MRISLSRAAHRRAAAVIPGGVNSPVRAFRAVGGGPLFIERAKGARIRDLDGNEFVDYVMSWGPLILGHAFPPVLAAIRAAAARGTSYGAPTTGEVELAELIREALPSMERVRLTSSGTEACMSALRVARGFTKRDVVVKFDGCYHGHSDGLLVKAGSGLATYGVPDSAGVPAGVAKQTVVLPYNELRPVERVLASTKVAAVIVEPVAGNMGVVAPREDFLPGLRRLCTKHGALLIFDEVISGFRATFGGAQTVFGVTPDLTTLGKIIGGGLPVGAYGGRREVMSCVSPEGPVYQAGTLSGNPLAVAAGLAQLRTLRDRPEVYARLEASSAALEEGLRAVAARRGLCVNRVGSTLTLFFQRGPVTDWATASRSDTKAFARFFRGMLASGIYLPPSQYEAWFVSAAHTGGDVARTLAAAERVLGMRAP
jgi:glutamate-1-semialdehyde 2,1-aminomutase